MQSLVNQVIPLKDKFLFLQSLIFVWWFFACITIRTKTTQCISLQPFTVTTGWRPLNMQITMFFVLFDMREEKNNVGTQATAMFQFRLLPGSAMLRAFIARIYTVGRSPELAQHHSQRSPYVFDEKACIRNCSYHPGRANPSSTLLIDECDVCLSWGKCWNKIAIVCPDFCVIFYFCEHFVDSKQWFSLSSAAQNPFRADLD